MLNKGPGSIRSNMEKLVQPTDNPKRDRAIKAIMAKNNITYEQAQYRQAYRIAQKQARKI